MIQSDYMAQAIAAARLGAGLTYRNPLVGAVIVKNDRVLAVGHHVGFGHAHAEVDAYQHVTHPEDVIGSTMYVTLEPCSHYGKTPPCAHQLVRWGVKEVYVAQQDPNPLVGGKGIAYLREHGVQIHVGLMETVARQLNRAYNFYYEYQRPLVTVKVAQSLDGKLSLNDGKRTYLTDMVANADVDHLRATQQAILIGSQTAIDDDPRLLVKGRVAYPPVRVLLDRRNRVSHTSRLWQTNEAPLWHFVTGKESTKGIEDNIEGKDTRRTFKTSEWSIDKVIQTLSDQGVQSVLVEGGAHIHDAFLRAGLVDQLIIYQVPEIFGGQSLASFTSSADSMRTRFTPVTIESCGNATKMTFIRPLLAADWGLD